VLEIAPDGTAAFGLGSDVVRFDLTGEPGEGIPYARDVQAPGGQSLAVISATKIATGSTEALTVVSVGADAPDCSIDGTINDLATNPDRSRLAGAVYDQEAKLTDIVIWSLADCQEMIRWATGVSFVPDIAWLPGGDRIASAGGDGQLRFWDVETGAQVHSLAVESDAGFKMHFSNDATRLVTATLWGGRMLRFFQSQ
jgi:WD40 repeat protein